MMINPLSSEVPIVNIARVSQSLELFGIFSVNSTM